MGRYIIPKEEKYFDMEDCDSRGYPIQKVREVEVEVDEKEWRKELEDIFLHIYANPVKACLQAKA